MAGNTVECQLDRVKANGVEFAVATPADDADIRKLLRENPMPGYVSLSLEREPDYFADTYLPNQTKQTIVARMHGRAVCVGSCTVRERFVNGVSRKVGYLGGLRLDKTVAGRFDILRRGYRLFHELQKEDPAEYYFTSIAADNERALEFLERGLSGMPRYEYTGEFVTLLLATRPDKSSEKIAARRPAPMEQFAARLNGYNEQFQFAPCWTKDEIDALAKLGLNPESFHSVQAAGQTVAEAALWDQRAFKQAVIRGYAPTLSMARPIINLVSCITGGPKLPAIGETLSIAFVSHLVLEPNNPETLINLFTYLRSLASQGGIDFISAGFAAGDPRLRVLSHRFPVREYRSRLYVVRWPDCGGPVTDLDGSILAPEVALL